MVIQATGDTITVGGWQPVKRDGLCIIHSREMATTIQDDCHRTPIFKIH